MIRLRYQEEERELMDPLVYLTGSRAITCGCEESHAVPLTEPVLEWNDSEWKIECLFHAMNHRISLIEQMLAGAEIITDSDEENDESVS